MIPKVHNHMADRLKKIDFLEEQPVPKKDKKKKQIISKGEVKIFQGKYIEKFATLRLKGLNIYGYEFGICYPKNRNYPIFIYQGIYVPKRAVVTVNYAYFDLHSHSEISGLKELLRLDEQLAEERLYKKVKPQYFLVDEVIENTFNGMVATRDIDDSFEDMITLFEKWHRNLEENYDQLPKETEAFSLWKSQFKDKFFTKDYGYTATKRYLGKNWTDKIFAEYLR